MGEHAAAGLGPEALTAALEALPDGVAIFDAEWTLCFINEAGAALVGRRAGELAGRSIWEALPELTGTIFHSFLLHARGAGGPVTWRGFYAPAGRWLSATAVLVGELLQVSIREVTSRLAEPVDDGGEPDLADDGDRDRLRFLAEVSESLITTLDAGKSAAQLAELAVSRLCDWAVVSLVGEDGGPGEEAWAHRDPARRADLDTYMTERLRGTGDDEAMVDALLSGQPVQMIPVRQEVVAPSLPTEEVRAAWRRLAAASYTIVPLRARGETFGVLALLNAGDRPPHTEREIATAVEVARRGGLALDNARLYGRQQKVAETLQHSLLTPPPQPDHLQIAVRYRPAGAYQQVGGDWYDAFQQPDGATLLVIGDVVGHNVDAAAAMGQIRSILRGLACDRPESPARILSRVDRVLTTLGVPTLATALLARIEQPADLAPAGLRRLRWSSAGHLPPLLLRPDGTARQLDSPPERLLGSGSACARSDQELLLCPGDTLVFYTDGLVEYGRTGIDEGIDRLTGHLADLADLPLEGLCDGLLDRVPAGRADDDIAVLALRCGPAPQPDQHGNAPGSSESGLRTGRTPAPGRLSFDADAEMTNLDSGPSAVGRPAGAAGGRRLGEQIWAVRPRPTVGPGATLLGRWEPAATADLTAHRWQLAAALHGGGRPAVAEEGAVERLLLAFEELASNALRHGSDPVRVDVTAADGFWLLDVSDAAVDQPPAPAVGRDAAHGGMGLYLVASICTAHGWFTEEGRKHAWGCIDYTRVEARDTSLQSVPGPRNGSTDRTVSLGTSSTQADRREAARKPWRGEDVPGGGGGPRRS
ncbi:MAG: putative sensor protein [Blastococcus sp.]|nr:putative sensor protein [Blastococcus sp.]